MKSKWTVKYTTKEVNVGKDGRGRCLSVEITTQPMPKNPLGGKNTDDPHPFSLLGEGFFGDDDVSRDVVDGFYVVYTANNEIVYSILETIINPTKLKASSGNVDWRWYRMKLIRILDLLWD